jgi:peptide deformylase
MGTGMAILPLVYLSDARLRDASKPIERVDDAVRKLAADMFETMHDADGLGLAAVQVGVHRRLIVLDVPPPGDPETPEGQPRPSHPLILINPTILTLGNDRRVHEEGCLSIPEFRVDIERPGSLRLAYTDEQGDRPPGNGDPARDRSPRWATDCRFSIEAAPRHRHPQVSQDGQERRTRLRRPQSVS